MSKKKASTKLLGANQPISAFSGQKVTFQAVVSSTSGVPTGTVTLLDNFVPFITVPLVNGSASYVTSSLATGSHSVNAVYNGDVAFLGSASSSASISILPGNVYQQTDVVSIDSVATLAGNAGLSAGTTTYGRTAIKAGQPGLASQNTLQNGSSNNLICIALESGLNDPNMASWPSGQLTVDLDTLGYPPITWTSLYFLRVTTAGAVTVLASTTSVNLNLASSQIYSASLDVPASSGNQSDRWAVLIGLSNASPQARGITFTPDATVTLPFVPVPVVAFSSDETTITITYPGDPYHGSLAINNLIRPMTLAWSYSPTGTIYWVATTGNDNNNGTSQGTPFATIGKAYSVVVPGDCVYILPGTYNENLLITKSGTNGNPIIFSCAPKAAGGGLGSVIISPTPDWWAANPHGSEVEITGAYVWLNGLACVGPIGQNSYTGGNENFSQDGITLSGIASQVGCKITNCVIYGNIHCGIKDMNHGASGHDIEGNVSVCNGDDSVDHGLYCPSANCTIQGNILAFNSGFGLHLYSQPNNLTVKQNLCFGNAWGGLLLSAQNSIIQHNTLASNGGGQPVGIMYFRDTCVNNVVTDNIAAFNAQTGNPNYHQDCSYDNGGGLLGDPSGNTDDYNCYYQGPVANALRAHNTVGTHELNVDPLFNNRGAYDFRLTDASPCIDAASDGTDMGCYQR